MPPLFGCVNDVSAASEELAARWTATSSIVTLLDEAATKTEVVTAIRDHLGRADRGDVALFWFSGHGSQQAVAPEHRWIEPGGMSQSLVCHDSRAGAVDLTDKELSALFDAIANRGAHVVAVLDCCHSGGGTRTGDAEFRIRGVPANTTIAPAAAFVPELGTATRALHAPHRPEHVALAACQPYERAYEAVVAGAPRGVFTTALLRALRWAGAGTTYRALMTAARTGTELIRPGQAPALDPVRRNGPADQPLFGGLPVAPATMTARWSVDRPWLAPRWLVDAGACHGIPDSVAAEVRLAVVGTSDEFGVERVDVGTTTVTPLDWTPDRDRQYPVELSRVPLPPIPVMVDGDSVTAEQIREAISGSAQLRPVTAAASLLVTTDRTRLRIRRPDGTPLTGDIDDVPTALARLAHIARWIQLRDLDNPSAGPCQVELEIVAALPGVPVVPFDEPALAPGPDGSVTIAYRHIAGRWRPPEVFVRLRNTADRPLWCVLLDLTPRFGAHAALFPGAFVAAGGMAAAADGGRITVALPPEGPVAPGGSCLDWCKLIVAEREIGVTALELPPIDSADSADRVGPATTTADLLGWTDRRHTAGSRGFWATTLIPLITRVPEE